MFYLKYRPQKIEDLDLELVREKLKEISAAKKLPHAFLFAGPKGTGKTSAARILAKTINCLKRKKGEVEPCNQCSMCQAITTGRALDLIEIDAASNRGIDDIRTLRERVRLAPSEAKYKVYVIDEAHMLTREAFNALLKTLEEPPEHAVFVLCTTEPTKLPGTIISRCLYLPFRKATIEEIKKSLQRVIKTEKIKIEPEAGVKIAQLADGSFRDAQKILEQLAMKDELVTAALVEKEAGHNSQTTDNFLQLLTERKVLEAIEEIGKQTEAGANLEEFILMVLEKLRRDLLRKIGVSQTEEEESLNLSKEELLKLMMVLEKAARNLKAAVIPQLPLEMAVIEWGEVFQESAAEVKTAAAPEEEEEEEEDGAGLKNILANWTQILQKIKPFNHSVEALLRSAQPANFNGRILTLEVFYQFHQERLNTEKNRSLIEKVISEVINKPIGLKCVLVTKKEA